MSILITGMEMPPNCCQCPVNMEVCKRGYKCLLAHPELYDKRADDCPLVPVPPHGRLIDADALYTRMEKAHTDWREHPERYNDVIPVNADEIFVLTEAVVIPAEEGE